MKWKGRKEVQFATQPYHNTMFKNVALEQKQATIRFLTKRRSTGTCCMALG